MTLWEWLDRIDKSIFKSIHSDGAIPALDGLINLLRNQYVWIPLYVFIIFWIFKYHRQYAWKFILLSAISFAITDIVSFQLLKPMFDRLRPCYEPELSSIIRHIISCGGEHSMPSSHAANHFGLATFWFFSIRFMNGKKWWLLFFWAFIIGYSQVYVGKHYPFDIVVGAVFGFMVGSLLSIVFRKWISKNRNGVKAPIKKDV